jgi:DNA polymerase elongation subunit (family B)
MQGWILDAYPDYDRDVMVLWLWRRDGAQRVEDGTFRPGFFVHAPRPRLAELRRKLAVLDEVAVVRDARRRTALHASRPAAVLEVVPRRYRDLRRVAQLVDGYGGYYDVRLFDVDLRFSQRYFLAHDVFPHGLVEYAHGAWRPQEEHFALDYPIPALGRVVLDVAVDAARGIPRFPDRLVGARLTDVATGEAVTIEGDEGAILEGLHDGLASLDPDILLTDGGDEFVLPYLVRKAREQGVALRLGREEQRLVERPGRSYFTYGKIVYKPGHHLLRGRVHIDRGHFAYRESGLEGLVELSRLALLPMQVQARLTPGSAITAMQVNQAHKDGVLVLWKKNLPEDFKTAEALVRADRGGFIFEPEVGLHEGLVELDFASLYPTIMARFNISPETLNCPCCRDRGRRVPGLGYHTCMERLGLVPRVLQPVLERRRYYKRMKREAGPRQGVYAGRDAILKWLLVTSFGYTGYRNARFGRIECHEAINAYARELLVRTMELAEGHGYDVVHGIVDSVWLRPTPRADALPRLLDHLNGALGLPLDLEGRYRWIVFLPCKTTGVGALNRYYGLFEDGGLKLRGIELRRHDTPTFVRRVQARMLGVLAEASSKEAFLALLPKAVDVLRRGAKALVDGRVPVHDLVVTKRVTKDLDDYVVMTAAVAALRQMKDRGFSVAPGDVVRYVVADEGSRRAERKVHVAEFLEGGERVDVEAYLRLLCRAGETLLSPFGYTEGKLLALCNRLDDVTPLPWDGAEETLPTKDGTARRSGVGYAIDLAEEVASGFGEGETLP